MTDLISKSALIDRLSEEAKRFAEIAIHSKGQAVDYYTGAKTGMAKAAIIVNTERNIDAVPVVRCKECWKRGRVQCRVIGLRGKQFMPWSVNFFCADGERRGDD